MRRKRRLLAAPLDGPAAIAVDLGRAGLLPGAGRTAAAPNRVLLGLGQAGTARRDHRRIHNLPAYRQPALVTQHRVEPLEQPLKRPGPSQGLAVEPDRLGVGYRIAKLQTDKPHEGEPILDLVVDLGRPTASAQPGP